MCNQTTLQHKIATFTKDGEHIARFLTETMLGKTPGVKVNHRMEAAKHLIRYGFSDADCDTISDRLSRAGNVTPLRKQGRGIQRGRARAVSAPLPPQQTPVGASGRIPQTAQL